MSIFREIQFSEKITEKFKKYLATEEFKVEVDKYQETFKCCGINGPEDYTNINKKVPESCGDHKEGCVDKFMKDIQNVSSPLFIVSIVTLILLVGRIHHSSDSGTWYKY